MIEKQQANNSLHNTKRNGNTIIVAGANGDLGHRICSYLVKSGATVRAIIRTNSNAGSLIELQKQGLQLVKVDFNDPASLASACQGGTCVVSALNGLEDVIIDVQSKLLDAAIAAGVPRFIPSDFSIDYTNLPVGSNRNLDLRRRFSQLLEESSITPTSIFNGMFTDLLIGEAPFVLFGINRVLCWGNPKQLLDLTTIDNTAQYTAYAALDNSSPRFLRIAGDVLSAQGLIEAATKATGKNFKLLKPGGLGLFKILIKITRTLAPAKNGVFPAWQGMQYMHNMFSGLAKLSTLDNDRYKGINWTTVQEVLRTREELMASSK